MTKQTAHKRRYKSGKIRIINPHVKKDYGMYPLGKERQLKIVWDKERLKRFYEDEKEGFGVERPEQFVEEKVDWDHPDRHESQVTSSHTLKSGASNDRAC